MQARGEAQMSRVNYPIARNPMHRLAMSMLSVVARGAQTQIRCAWILIAAGGLLAACGPASPPQTASFSAAVDGVGSTCSPAVLDFVESGTKSCAGPWAVDTYKAPCWAPFACCAPGTSGATCQPT